MIEKSTNSLEWPALQIAVEAAKAPVKNSPSILQRGLRKFFPEKTPLSMNRHSHPNGVYILVYHSVVDPDNRQVWEEHYRKGEVTAFGFRSQIEYMMEHMNPIALSEVPGLFREGNLQQSYFAITFDDGFRNNLTLADPIIQEYGLKPTVFVNSEFASLNEVFYRVLTAVLAGQGHGPDLAKTLRRLAGKREWSDDGAILFNQMKQYYLVDLLEQAADETYRLCLGDPEDLAVHLQVDEIKSMQKSGWEIGNHTQAHRLLSHQTPAMAIKAIEDNLRFWNENGVDLIDFLAFPVGRAMDVNQVVSQWLDRSPGTNGIFANNGINFMYNRKEWLRFSFGKKTKPEELDEIIKAQIYRTKTAYAALNRETAVRSSYREN
ncbi:MAG: polysaccharide deacetylase family protein [Magnetococcales bacterium]|nr:polysaccharide deacetylase family protein [Magnetococcales bacterium]